MKAAQRSASTLGRRRCRLVETAEFNALAGVSGADVDFQGELVHWEHASVPELSIVLVHVEHAARVHKLHHWQAKADPFYGDHLLFDRLSSDVAGFVDKIAEKAIGMGGPENVDLVLRTEALARLASGAAQHALGTSMPSANDLAQHSLDVTVALVQVLSLAVDSMKASGTLTRGIDNMLAGLEDTIEDAFYLLKRRIA